MVVKVTSWLVSMDVGIFPLQFPECRRINNKEARKTQHQSSHLVSSQQTKSRCDNVVTTLSFGCDNVVITTL